MGSDFLNQISSKLNYIPFEISYIDSHVEKIPKLVFKFQEEVQFYTEKESNTKKK